jgi:hypothetical protein
VAFNKRRVFRWVIGIAVTLLLVVVTWVFPAIYHARYDPETKNNGGSAAPGAANPPAGGALAAGPPAADPTAPAPPADAATAADSQWHPTPTAEQDRI